MSVEGDPTSSTLYIDDLNATYPTGAEGKAQGDDHLRLIKKAIKNTFPNIDAPVTATPTELNYVDITTLGTQQASKAVTADANNTVTVPSGGEINFASGSALQIGGTAVTVTAAELNFSSGVTSAIQTQIDNLKKFDIQFNLDVGANGDYTILQDAQFAFTIDSAYYKTASGSITINVKYDGTNSVTDLSAKSVTSTEGNQTAGATKTVAAGNTVSITTSSNSSAVKLSVTLHCTRS